jgi:hypothetical protein
LIFLQSVLHRSRKSWLANPLGAKAALRLGPRHRSIRLKTPTPGPTVAFEAREHAPLKPVPLPRQAAGYSTRTDFNLPAAFSKVAIASADPV